MVAKRSALWGSVNRLIIDNVDYKVGHVLAPQTVRCLQSQYLLSLGVLYTINYFFKNINAKLVNVYIFE